MTGIHDHLIRKSVSGELIYTAELIPQGGRQSESFVDNSHALVSFRVLIYAHWIGVGGLIQSKIILFVS